MNNNARDNVIRVVDVFMSLLLVLSLVASVFAGLSAGGLLIVGIPLATLVAGSLLTGGWFCLSGIYFQLKRLNGDKINDSIF